MGDRLGDVLDRARRQAALSQFELWVRYFELGGLDSPLELEGYLFGALQPTTHEHDLLVHALNERFAELGRGHPVPYSDPRITRGDRLSSVRAILWDISRAGPGSWDRVCEACAEALSVTGAAISLLSGDQRTLLGTSDEVAWTIEEAHFTFGEGPGVDAARLGVTVHEPDLPGTGPTRWPMFTAQALDAGVAAIDALPLRVGAGHIGTMHLYRNQPGPLTAPQLADALTVANLITHTVLALQADAPTGTLAAPLAEMPFRRVVHQATGMIAAQLNITDTDALARLRSHAYRQDRPIDDIAAQVVARTLRFDDQDEHPD
jgi:hypothetical protein